jgi:hypothetical protein
VNEAEMGESVNVDTVTPPTDTKGRVLPEVMSDREIAIETLTYMRVMMDLFEAMGNHPMAQTLGMVFPARR